jgi:hypothetical protein
MRSTSPRGRLRDPLEELSGAAVLPFIEGEVGFLQDGRDVLCQGLTNMAAKDTAH